MVFLTLMIGLLNLALGFVLAVKLGFGPPTLLDAWEALTSVGGPSAAGAADDDGQLTDEEVQAMLQSGSPDDFTSMLDDAEMDDLLDEPLDLEEPPAPAVAEEDAIEEEESDAPAIWNLDEKFVETSILKLNVAMIKSGARATSLDARLRACAGRTDSETIQACLKDLTQDCESYLAEQSAAADELHNRLGELGELSALGEEIEMANMEQAAQIETTLNNLKNMDFTSDLEAANTRLLAELNHLRVARHRLRDSQEEAFLAVARYEQRLDKIAEQLFNDSMTKLPGRIGLEVTLHQWWKVGHHRNRQMNAALIDLDAFEHVNENFGAQIGDKVLIQTGKFFRAQCGTGDLVARFAGQRFFLMLVDVGPRAAIKKIETLRQQFENITFLHADKPIRLTIRCAISEVKPEETEDVLLSGLDQVLKKAKKEGANHSFTHDGREIERVESPNFGCEPMDIAL